MGLLKDLGNAIVTNIKEENTRRKEIYNKYYEWASRLDDERVIDEYRRKMSRSDSSTNALMEKKALRDILKERGYANEE